MAISLTALISGLGAGLASTPHCAAMCGPLAAAACNTQRGAGGPLRYQAGRTLGYAFVGSVAGQLGEVLALRALPPFALPVFVAAVLAWFGLRLLRPRAAPGLVTLRTARPRTTRFALAKILPREPLLLGTLSALLPCGALAAALLLAGASGNASDGALLMAGFATTSGAGVLGLGYLLSRLLRVERRGVTRALAALFLLAAAFVLVRPVYSAAAAARSGRTHAAHLSCH